MYNAQFFKKDIILWLMILAPFVVIFIYWNQFPQQVPVHWNLDGQPDRYAPKGIGVFLGPLINLALYFFLLLIPKIDPKKANFSQFEGTYRAIRLLVHTVLSVTFIVGLLSAEGYQVNTKFIVNLLMPAMILILGNFMGKIRPNYFVGVRTPWTLANETVWVKTHRVTGRVWVAASFIDLFINIFTTPPHIIFTLYLLTLIIVPVLYSYIIFQQIQKEQKNTTE